MAIPGFKKNNFPIKKMYEEHENNKESSIL